MGQLKTNTETMSDGSLRKSSRLKLNIEGKTVPEALIRRVATSPEGSYCLYKVQGQYERMNWSEAWKIIVNRAQYLIEIGIEKGDRVAILANTSHHWNLSDLAIQCVGAVTVPIYQSNLADEVGFVLKDSGSKAIFVEDQCQFDKVLEIHTSLGVELGVIGFTPINSHQSLRVQDHQSIDSREDWEQHIVQIQQRIKFLKPDDLCSIVYTSGTTGVPKGAMLTHYNFAEGLSIICRDLDLNSEVTTLTFLPFAHILGRIEGLAAIFSGMTLGYAESIQTITQNFMDIRPNVIVSVPRIFEKVYAKIQAQVENSSPYKKQLFYWAVDIGRQVARLRSQKASIPWQLQVKFQVATKLVLSKVKEKLGGNLQYCLCGGAPLDKELCEFFHACDVKILEGYGLTETLGPVTVNEIDDYDFGTVGRPMSEAKIKLAEDGELLCKGPQVFLGYYENPKATEEVFTSDGWFKTGDIGEIDSRGFIRITDRKKELIVTAGGKNIAPQKIENMLKSCRNVSNSMVYGDKQKFLVALVTFTEAMTEEMKSNFEIDLKGINAKLPSYETIKKYHVLEEDFTIEKGELTPSLKIKRKVITEKYKAQIEALYK